MDDVRGYFKGPPHGTTSAVEITNKNINIISFESRDKIQKTENGPYCAISANESSSLTLINWQRTPEDCSAI